MRLLKIWIGLLLSVSLLFFLSCKRDESNRVQYDAPIVTTSVVSTISSTSATLGGEVTNDGGSSITERGICYSTNPDPTINNTKISLGTGMGSFSTVVSGLLPNTVYYVRAYASNSVGLSYGNQQSFASIAIPPPPVDSAVSLYIGGWKSLYAFNAQTGQLKWQKDLGDHVFSSPAYANGKVYVGCANNKLYAFDTSGNSVWTVTTNSSIGSQSPIVKNGIVYICNEQSRDIYAFNAETGTGVWHYDATEPGMTVFFRSDITIFDNTVYINSGHLYAIDASTGVLKWKYQDGGEVTPVKLNNKLYNLSGEALMALNIETGALLWKKESFPLFNMPLSLNAGNGKLFYSDDSFICALDTTNGSVIWQTNVFISPPLQTGYSPVLIGDSAYFRTHGRVQLYNAQTGSYIWQTLAEDVTSNMTIVNNTLYYSSRKTVGPTSKYYLFAVDLHSPNTYKWVSPYGASFPFLVSSPCIVTKSGKAHRFGKVFN